MFDFLSKYSICIICSCSQFLVDHWYAIFYIFFNNVSNFPVQCIVMTQENAVYARILTLLFVRKTTYEECMLWTFLMHTGHNA